MAGYRERTPPGPLHDLVEVAWQGRTGPSPSAQRVLPDGCMDLIAVGGRIVVAGPDTAAHRAESAPGTVTTGLRFRPGALPALLGVPADALRDRRADLADVLRPPGAATRRDMGVVLATSDSPEVPFDDDLVWLAATAAALRARDAASRPALPPPLPRAALRALARGMPAAELADRLGVTSRTLHRRCVATLGYGPATARRVLRFRAAGALLFDGVAPAEVAARTGYADQPHLSREVRALAGVSPAALAAS